MLRVAGPEDLDDLHAFGFEVDPAQQPDRRLIVDNEHTRQELSYSLANMR